MKNVLFLHSSSEMYGSDKSLYNLLNNLDKKKYKIYVILPSLGPLVNLIREIENVEVIIGNLAVLRRKNLNIKGFFSYGTNLLKSIFFNVKIIKENKIDIIYTNTAVIFSGAISAKLMKRKSIWHIREIIENKFERQVVSRLVNWFADIIIGNSKATGQSITTDSGKLKVVHNVIDTKNVDLSSKVSNTTITIGMAGRINRWKGQKLFVDVAELVLAENNNINFLIAGSPFEGETFLLTELEEYIQSKKLGNKVTLLGLVQNMNDFYNKLDIFVLPSIQPEPFGLVILEAMAREIPVIATNHGGPTEIIINKENGYLVDHNNVEEISRIILNLAKDGSLREMIGKNGKLNQKINFSIDNYVEKIELILDTL